MKEKDNVYLWGISLAVLGVVAYYIYKKRTRHEENTTVQAAALYLV